MEQVHGQRDQVLYAVLVINKGRKYLLLLPSMDGTI